MRVNNAPAEIRICRIEGKFPNFSASQKMEIMENVKKNNDIIRRQHKLKVAETTPSRDDLAIAYAFRR